MSNQYTSLYITNHYFPVELNEKMHRSEDDEIPLVLLSTLVSNLLYFGYAPSKRLYNQLEKLSEKSLINVWKQIKPILSAHKATDVQMDQFVVYKNFPKECLDKDQSTYWLCQILIYMGVPAKLFTKEQRQRDPLFENVKLTTLDLLPNQPVDHFMSKLMNKTTAWTDEEYQVAVHLFEDSSFDVVDFNHFSFSDNAAWLANHVINLDFGNNEKTIHPEFRKLKAIANNNKPIRIKVSSVTDVLRVSATMKMDDRKLISGQTMMVIGGFDRLQSRIIHTLLNSIANHESFYEQVAERKRYVKHLFKRIYVSEMGSEQIKEAYDLLYHKQLPKSFNSALEFAILNKDFDSVKDLLSQRSGVLVRRYNQLRHVFGIKAKKLMMSALPKLTIQQLMNFKSFVNNDMNTRMIRPNGSWTKVQLIKSDKKMTVKEKEDFNQAIDQAVSEKLSERFPNGVYLAEDAKKIKLPSNTQILSGYGLGTRFPIHDAVKFIRTASYWKVEGSTYNVWFDNGIAIFDANMNNLDNCCWNNIRVDLKKNKTCAIFSGDPTIAGSPTGEACQMIDLYLDEMIEMGARYVFWGIYSYNSMPFSSADSVLGTLQMGESAEDGKLYEPSRAQLIMKPFNNSVVNYMAYIDLETREIVYLDVNLCSNVRSIADEMRRNSETIPKLSLLIKYAEHQPSVYDVFKGCKQASLKDADAVIAFSDKGLTIEDKEAFILMPENTQNRFSKLKLEEILSS